MELPAVIPAGGMPPEAETPAKPMEKEHDGCPFYEAGRCKVLNESIQDLGKEADVYDEGGEDESSLLDED